MTLEEYLAHDGLGLADLVRRGEVSPSELVALARRQLRRVNPVLNAVVHEISDEAPHPDDPRPAADPTPPFVGVPFLIKDLLTLCAGEPHTSGSRLMRDYVPTHDSEVVRRFRSAGLIILGKTNVPEFGLPPYTEPELFGPCRNPWNPRRTPGGSSGGSAAAVAGGIVPLAGGNDGGGSIRIPASCCGLFGLKPSRGRVPTGLPDRREVMAGFVQDHVITRSVRDSAAMLDVLSPPAGGAPCGPPPPVRPFAEEVERDPERLRVAFTSDALLGGEVAPSGVAAVEETATLLQTLGHDVEEASPPVEAAELRRAYVTLVCAELQPDLKEAEALTGRRAGPRTLEPETWALSLLGKRMDAATLASALRTVERTALSVAPFFELYDVLLTPTLARPPAPVGSLRPSPAERTVLRLLGHLRAGAILEWAGGIDRTADRGFDFSPFTPLFNATGQPAMTVPLHWSDDGLPVGVHFATRVGGEALLLRLAGQLERARPWFDRLPEWIVPSDGGANAPRAFNRF